MFGVVLDLFAGTGALSEAAVSMLGGGADSMFAVEGDPDCLAVLEDHGYGVVSDDAFAPVPPGLHGVDVLCAGTPCQGASQLRRGHGPSDVSARGFEALERYVDACHPSVVVWENVEGARRYMVGGSSLYSSVVTLLRRRWYHVTHMVLSASSIGACHRRKRVFVLGVDWGRVPPRFRAAGAPHVPADDRLLVATPVASDASHRSVAEHPHQIHRGRKLTDCMAYEGGAGPYLDRRSYALDCHGDLVGRRYPVGDVLDDSRHIRPEFYEWLMGWPEGFTAPASSDAARIRLCGNGVQRQQAQCAVAWLWNDQYRAFTYGRRV